MIAKLMIERQKNVRIHFSLNLSMARCKMFVRNLCDANWPKMDCEWKGKNVRILHELEGSSHF
jgi:hypothetical protein